MERAIAVINAGSSSMKFAAYRISDADEPQLVGKGQIEGIRTAPRFHIKDDSGELLDEKTWPEGSTLSHAECLSFLIDWIQNNAEDLQVVAVGHRVVHGGLQFSAATLITEQVLEALDAFVALAPLHQPHNLAAIRALAKVNPNLPQVACFDTAFHRSQPKVATLFALPRAMTESGVRRYGFHGLSYAYIARVMPRYSPETSKIVVAHLGSGASMCAIHDGRSMESTMGFTAVDGLPMGTRTGALDPGVVLYCLQELNMDAKAIERLLYSESGLLGVSGISNDMRDLMASDQASAREAIELFVYHICKQVGALAAALQGIDALVFTAGIGENSPRIRELVCQRSAWLEIDFDAEANSRGGPLISTPDSPVSAWVIPTDEEGMIAIDTLKTLRAELGDL